MYKITSLNLELCRILHLEINLEIGDRSVSPYGIQQKICRCFLSSFSRYGILVAPQRILNKIMIVGRCDCLFNESIGLNDWLAREFLTVKSINRVDCSSLEECIRFSLVVWLEPQQYYRCGSALIKGPFPEVVSSDFTWIAFAVHCTSLGEVFLRLLPETVRLFSLKTWQLQNRSEVPRWVFCLPRLGRGQVVAQYSRIPRNSAFCNYAEMRAYWKNCHGYDLPTEEPQIYYDVIFKGFKNSFLYPDFCVLSSEPMGIREDVSTHVALDEFSQALASQKRFICMEEVKLSLVDCNFIDMRRRIFGPVVFEKKISHLAYPRHSKAASCAEVMQTTRESDMMRETKGSAGSNSTMDFNANECTSTSCSSHHNMLSNVAKLSVEQKSKSIRNRKRLIEVD